MRSLLFSALQRALSGCEGSGDEDRRRLWSRKQVPRGSQRSILQVRVQVCPGGLVGDLVTHCGPYQGQVFECENTLKRTCQRPFTSAVRASFAESPGPLPSPSNKLNLGLAEMQFPAVLGGVLALFSLFDLLARYQFLLAPFLCKFGPITRPILSKSGEERARRPHRGSGSGHMNGNFRILAQSRFFAALRALQHL